jgi:uncharacterized protein (DUF488 family)
MENEKIIYTVGTSNRSIQEFLEVLKTFGIQRVVDVRRFPVSRFDHFTRENVSLELEQAGLEYDFFGDRLGGYRSGGYKDYIEVEAFQEALSKVERLGEKEAVAVVCAEKLPWRCHRRFIGAALQERGWKVIHILDKDRAWEPEEQIDLFNG